MELTANQLISLDRTLYGHQHLCDECGNQLVVCDLTPEECRQMAPGEWSWHCLCVDNEPNP